MATLVEPYQVSSLIKICRYGLLVAGIFYGISKHKAYSIKQRRIRENYRLYVLPKLKAETEAAKIRSEIEQKEMLESIMTKSENFFKNI